MRLTIGDRDVTELVSSVTTSGSRSEASRTLSAEILQPPADKNVPAVPLELEAKVEFDSEDGQTFEGWVTQTSRTTSGNTVTVTAQSRGDKLTNTKVTKKITGATPAAAAAELITAAGLKVGELAPAPGTVARKFVDTPVADAIMAGYILSGQQNDTSYVLTVDGETASVVEFGKKVTGTLAEGSNLQVATYAESLDWEDGEEDTEGHYERGQKATVQGLALPGAVTGMAVQIKETYTGLTGIFYVDSDQHSWAKGMYTNKLTLVFDRLSDDTAAGEEV